MLFNAFKKCVSKTQSIKEWAFETWHFQILKSQENVERNNNFLRTVSGVVIQFQHEKIGKQISAIQVSYIETESDVPSFLKDWTPHLPVRGLYAVVILYSAICLLCKVTIRKQIPAMRSLLSGRHLDVRSRENREEYVFQCILYACSNHCIAQATQHRGLNNNCHSLFIP